MKFTSIIVAAGRGLRARSAANKVLVRAGNIPVLYYSLKRFSALAECSEIILVVSKEDLKNKLFDKQELREKFRVDRIVVGGEHRIDSVKNGFQETDPAIPVIAIHDAARPFVTDKLIKDVAAAAEKYGAAIAAVPAGDTLKQAGKEKFVEKTLPRRNVFRAQTPQAFRRELLKKAYSSGIAGELTDEAQLVESIGIRVKLVNSLTTNMKITTPEDLELARKLLPVWER